MFQMFYKCPLLKDLNNPYFNSLLYKDNTKEENKIQLEKEIEDDPLDLGFKKFYD